MFIVPFVCFGWEGGLIDNEILAMNLKFDICCIFVFPNVWGYEKETVILRTIKVQTI